LAAFFLNKDLFVVINDAEETISGMEIDPAIVFHLVAASNNYPGAAAGQIFRCVPNLPQSATSVP